MEELGVEDMEDDGKVEEEEEEYYDEHYQEISK